MKDTEMHQGLENELLRNYFAQQLLQFQIDLKESNEIHKKNAPEFHKIKGVDYSLLSIRNSLEKNQRDLKAFEGIKAVSILMKAHGWEEYDLSDEVMRTGDYLHLAFIGTREEHEALLAQIEA